MCKFCRERSGKELKRFASSPRCAFGNHYTDDYNGALFDKENWNCKTMNYLRLIAIEVGLHQRRDVTCGTIACVPFENNYGQGYIVMSYYKRRGKVGNAVIMYDDHSVRQLTEKIAVSVVEDYMSRGVI